MGVCFTLRFIGIFVALFIVSSAFAAELTTGAPLCGYGLYKINGECISYTTQATECHQINNQNSYVLNVNQATYASPNNDGTCDAGYDMVAYDSLVVYPIYSGVIGLAGSPLCGYNQYKLNGKCYDWSDSEIDGRCPDGFYKTTANQGTYMQYIDDDVCQAGYDEFDMASLRTADDLIVLHPIFNGVIGLSGAPLGTGTTLDTSTICMESLGERYYKLDLSTYENPIYTFPENGVCASDYVKISVANDCKNIDISNQNESDRNSATNQINQLCAILCTDPSNPVYNNSGQCSNYCNVGGKDVRFHARKPDGTIISYPLYTSNTTVPGIHVNMNGQMCHGNLFADPQKNNIMIKYNDIIYRMGE